MEVISQRYQAMAIVLKTNRTKAKQGSNLKSRNFPVLFCIK